LTITTTAAHLARWNAFKTGIPYYPEFAIPTYWREHPELGSPINKEDQEDGEAPGVVLQSFTGGVVRWRPESGVELVTG
jgi:hypothetical protein